MHLQVQHVIQYDFPRFISDYIHRAGRVGRIGSRKSGKVSSFVTRPHEIELVQKLEVRTNRIVHDTHNAMFARPTRSRRV
jgi:ATP-dependent RNA helicase DDX28